LGIAFVIGGAALAEQEMKNFVARSILVIAKALEAARESGSLDTLWFGFKEGTYRYGYRFFGRLEEYSFWDNKIWLIK